MAKYLVVTEEDEEGCGSSIRGTNGENGCGVMVAFIEADTISEAVAIVRKRYFAREWANGYDGLHVAKMVTYAVTEEMKLPVAEWDHEMDKCNEAERAEYERLKKKYG